MFDLDMIRENLEKERKAIKVQWPIMSVEQRVELLLGLLFAHQEILMGMARFCSTIIEKWGGPHADDYNDPCNKVQAGKTQESP